MTISIISLIGIIGALALFVYLSFKGFNIVIAGILASLAVILTSGKDVLTMVTDVWSAGFAGYLKGYFLVMIFSACVGHLMGKSGAAKRIALLLYNLCKKSKKHAKLFGAMLVPIIYMCLNYIGVSGLVIIFTVLPIGVEIFREFNIPWRLYCYACIMICSSWLPASLAQSNLVATGMAGVSISAAPVLGLVSAVVFAIVGFALLAADLRRAEKRGEGFMETGRAYLESNSSAGKGFDNDDNLPSLLVSVIPFFGTIIFAVVLGMNIIIALFLDMLLALAAFWKYIPNKKLAITEGLASAFNPAISVAICTGLAYVMKASPGFEIVITGIDALPPTIAGVTYLALMATLTGSQVTPISGMGELALASFAEAGLSAATSARLASMSIFPSIPPHSSAIANIVTIGKMDYKKIVGIYLKVTWLGGLAAVAVSIVLVNLGLFV